MRDNNEECLYCSRKMKFPKLSKSIKPTCPHSKEGIYGMMENQKDSEIGQKIRGHQNMRYFEYFQRIMS